MRRSIVIFGTVVFMTGCASPPPPSDQAVAEEAGREIRRVCSLPPRQREAEIKKLEAQSGLVLFCGDH